MIMLINKQLRNRKGFTMVELIVVIAILGILATIAVPRVLGFQEDARAKADKSNATLILNAIEMAIAKEELQFHSTTGDSLVLPSATTTSLDLYGTVPSGGTSRTGGVEAVLVPKYLNSLPHKANNAQFTLTVVDKVVSIN